MIQYSRSTLKNGLTVIVHTDKSTPFVCVNTLYKVGSRNESEDKTGFAHLFEHLMFGGSVNIPDFDREVQMAGGENNAYTTFDYTNYYTTLPAANLETALWLESDRMMQLAFSQQSLNVQKNVVVEEFKQRYLNAPYGDVWTHLRPLAYHVHPYKWNVIGKDPEHIERATLDDVRSFFRRFYAPNNAVVVLTGNIEEKQAFELVEKWFNDIPATDSIAQNIPAEPLQNEARRLVLTDNNVPAHALYKVYHTGGRTSEDFYACDLISDILSNGNSSRLYQNLIKKEIFSSLDAYVTGDFDPGLFVFSGRISPSITPEEADNAILNEIDSFINATITDRELEKVLNKAEARSKYSEINYQNKAANLALYEAMGNVELINTEIDIYKQFTIADLKRFAAEILNPINCSTLMYLGKL
ncbi:MAG: insulinase family protein [Culturomica sp.]|jgi:predicted Zn-dependent peptidase|nr:insulinase family protein [Culturomica sp.]